MIRLRLAMLWLILFAIVIGDRATAAEPIRLRVLSYNIHHAEGMDRKLDLERIARVIRSVSPDLVALQEVDQSVKRSSSVDQPAELARLTEMQVAFGKNIELQGGGYGNAILSRHPITRQQNHPLPNFEHGEQRGLIEAEIAVPGLNAPLLFLATHLDHRSDDRERLASAAAINELIGNRPDQPAILAGDLNDGPESATLHRFKLQWTRANERPQPTIPVVKPSRQIDFVLVRPRARWKTIEVRVLDEPVASDHLPILAVLDLLPETPAAQDERQ